MDAEPFRTLYEIAKKDNDLPAAAEYLKKYTELQPNDDTMLLALGDLLYTLKDLPGSLAAYRSALKANPSAQGFYERYVSLVSTLARPQELVEAMNGAIAAKEANVAMYSRLGGSIRMPAISPRRFRCMSRLPSSIRKTAPCFPQLAECQAKNGNAEAAVVSYEQALVMNPKRPTTIRRSAIFTCNSRRPKRRFRLIRSTSKRIRTMPLPVSSENRPSLRKIILMRSNTSEWSAAPDTQSPQFLLVYGNACYQAREDAKALEIYKKLAVLMPQNAEVFQYPVRADASQRYQGRGAALP